PPPDTRATFPARGASARTTVPFPGSTRSEGCAAARPRSASETTSAGALMSLRMPQLYPGAAPRPRPNRRSPCRARGPADNGMPPRAGGARFPRVTRARTILYDCDTGIDDAMTLLYLASLVRAGEADLAGVGTVHGNVDPLTGALNTLRVLELAGIKAGEEGVPVAVGAARPMAQEVHYAADWHGTDGLGDTGLPEPEGRPVAEPAAAQI